MDQIFAPAFVCNYYNIIYTSQMICRSNNIKEFFNGKKDSVTNSDLKIVVTKLQEDFGGDFETLQNWCVASNFILRVLNFHFFPIADFSN